MNRRALTFLAVVMTAGLQDLESQQSIRPSDDAEAIRSLIAKVAQANNAGDVETWVGLFASDFVYMAPNTLAVSTRHQLVEVAKTGFRHQAAIQIEPLEIRVFGDWAFARNAVSGTVKLFGTGEVVSIDVKQLVVYARGKDGQWRIARLMSNANK